MADSVFINGRSAIHAGSPGQSMAFPDVNLCPPTPPAGPIPMPLPNIAKAADLQGGAGSVVIGGNPMGKQSSFFAKSTGNESAQSTGGGVVSHVVQGKAYFTSFSVGVSIEGEPAVRHLDMMTHNHAAQSPPNAAMGTYLGSMDPAVVGAAKPPPKQRKDDGKSQTNEIFVDHVNKTPTGGVDAMKLVSADSAYSSKLPLSAASPKGGLLCLKFEKVLSGKAYSLFMVSGNVEIPFFTLVPFALIAEHTPGDEKLPPPDPPPGEPSDDGLKSL